MQKTAEIDIAAYTAEQVEKVGLPERLLAEYNSGREKTLFRIAVGPLSVDKVRSAIQEAGCETAGLPLKEKAKYMTKRLRKTADQHGIELKLRKKSK